MEETRTRKMGLTQILKIVLFFLVLLIGVGVLYTIRGTLLPFVIAVVLSYLLMPVVDFLESRKVNRILAVSMILVSIFGLFISMFILVVPILVQGVEDMMSRISGEKGHWSCLIVNHSDEVGVRIDRIESSNPNFSFVGPPLPLELPPGDRDTLKVRFNPNSVYPDSAFLNLYGNIGSTEEFIRLYVTGNFRSGTENAPRGTGVTLVDGPFRIDLSDTSYHFGRVDPSYLNRAKAQINGLESELEAAFPMFKGIGVAETLSDNIQIFATDLLKEVPDIVGSLLSGVTFVVIVPLVLFFFLSQRRSIKKAFIQIVPNRYFEMVLNLVYRIDVQLGGYIRGMVLSVVIISLLSVIGLYVIGLEYFLVVGVVAGVSNVIPYVGPLIGIITGTVASVLQYSALSWSAILPVVVVFLIVQVLDNVFVAPVVVARSVNLHPLVVIFVVLAGSQLFGAVGMILAVPATAVIKVSIQTIYEGLRSYSL